jgi:hypothetical protein
MNTNFNLVSDNNESDSEEEDVNERTRNSSYLTRSNSESPNYKRSNYFSPTLNVNNDAMGLDMLVNNKIHLDDNGSEKTNIFPTSDDDDDEDDDEDEDEEEEEYNSKKQNNASNSFTPSYFNNSDSRPSLTKSSASLYPKEKTREEINNEKAELLYQFDRLEKKGYKIPKNFCMDSSLEEMKQEFERMKKDKEVDASVAFQRKMLLAFTTGVEFLNSKFDPFDVKLDGWSENIHESIDDYDDVFEDLHNKYSSKSKMSPEMKLLMMMGGSAFMFHLTNTMFKTSLPQMGDVLKKNPDLMKQFASATANTMAQSGSDQTGMSSMFSNMFKSNSTPPIPQNTNTSNAMRGPSTLDSLLNNLDIGDDNRLETMSTATPSEISEMTETNSIRNLLSSKKRGGKAKHSLNI